MPTAIKIPREAVSSSNLASIGYDHVKKILAVEFKNGAIFHYAGVSLETVTAFYVAPSRGAYFSANIKGKFSGQKMTGTCPKCGAVHGWIGDLCEDCGCAEYEDVRKERTA